MISPNILYLPKIVDYRGNLSFFENSCQIPFDIKRVYWIHDVPSGETRGGHAFRSQNEFIVALSGSFDVVLDNGSEPINYTLSRSNYGLYIPKMNWRELSNFSTNAVVMVVSDSEFLEEDYIRDYRLFRDLIKK
ncbi:MULTISPECIES: sugar 3,4-ketoisomerase [Sphingobacterium]|jgi:dTDP-4-dehydrorhamnose 3,5-epimerase-like enzyme|uniref:sugar 3,4-ketoisomerase n=1 Tax=Sphingobacterium TaxID=28453 RepID=UPI00257B5C26|nr:MULTISPECIES: FdtA/QdtA family cupin domain-containing protein [Sphingobacterium]